MQSSYYKGSPVSCNVLSLHLMVVIYLYQATANASLCFSTPTGDHAYSLSKLSSKLKLLLQGVSSESSFFQVCTGIAGCSFSSLETAQTSSVQQIPTKCHLCWLQDAMPLRNGDRFWPFCHVKHLQVAEWKPRQSRLWRQHCSVLFFWSEVGFVWFSLADGHLSWFKTCCCLQGKSCSALT